MMYKKCIRREKPPENKLYEIDPEKPWTVIQGIKDEGKKWIRSNNLEEVSIISYDGLKLHGYFLQAKEKTDKTVLMMHGYRSLDFNDFGCSAKFFHEYGYNVLLPDQRAHGKSQGKNICFGVKERFDCKDWIDFLIKKTGEDSTIFLMGVSMGCATVTMTLGFDLPKNVKGCISDCGFTSPAEILTHILKNDMKMPKFPLLYMHNIGCKVLANFGLWEYSTIDALKTNKIPILFIHGGQDDFVPTWMTHENYKHCKSPKEILIIEKAKHAQCFELEPKKCWEKTKTFVEKYQNS